MRSLAIIFNYIKKYPKMVTGYFMLNLFSALFSLISLTMLAPFLTLIFGLEKEGNALGSRFKFGNISDAFYRYLSEIIHSDDGRIHALGLICIIIVATIVLKNIFLYAALYFLTPIRNGIINDMRNDMFGKILQLPIGFFNEQKKGDIMS